MIDLDSTHNWIKLEYVKNTYVEYYDSNHKFQCTNCNAYKLIWEEPLMIKYYFAYENYFETTSFCDKIISTSSCDELIIQNILK